MLGIANNHRMKQSFPLRGNKFQVLEQLKSFQTPLEKIDYLEVLAHDMRDKLDWMKRDEASREPGNELELSKRNDSLSAEAPGEKTTQSTAD